MSLVGDSLPGVLIALIAVLLYVFIKNRLKFFDNMGIENVKPTVLDLLGSFSITALFDYPNKVYKKMSSSDRSYIGYFQFIKPQLLVLQPSMVEDILIKDFSHFSDHGFDINIKSDPLAGHLFNMKGDEWRTLRHKLVPTFTSGKLRGMVPIMEECADSLIEDIKQDPSLQKDTDLKNLYKIYSLAVIAKCAFGIDPESIRDPKCEFKKMMYQILRPSALSQFKIGLLVTVPYLTRLFGMKLFPKNVDDFFLEMTKETFEMRKKSGVKRNDFIQLLLELKEKGSVQVDSKDLEQDEKDTLAKIQKESTVSKLEFTEELLAAQVFVFLVGGFENTAYLTAITSYLLSKNPDVQKRVREEVLEMKAKNGSLNYQALRDMKLLGACLDEALRLYGPVPSLLRQCTKPYTMKDGKKVDKGMGVIIPVQSFHYDNRYWSEPEKFDPDRFISGESITPGTYLPFGDGPRLCIAQRLALITAKLALAKMVMQYNLLPSPKTKEPIKIKLGMVADVEGGLWGTFEPIK